MTEIEELTMYEYRALREERNITRWQYAALTNRTAELRHELADMDAQALADLVEGLAHKAAEYEIGLCRRELREIAAAVIAEELDRAFKSVKFFETDLSQYDSEPIATYETFLMGIVPRRRRSDSEPSDLAVADDSDRE